MLQKLYQYLLKNQIIFALFLVGAGWLLFQTRGILISIFLAYIINAALLPIVHFLHKKGVPHFFAAFIPFVIILIFIALTIVPLVPFVAGQVKSLLVGLPTYVKQSAEVVGLSIDANQIQNMVSQEVNNAGRNAFAVTSRVFGGLFSTLTVLVVSFYLILYHDRFKNNIAHLFSKADRPRVLETLELVDDKLGSWLRGQLILSLFIGVITWIVLSLLGLPYAVPLAILAGILEVVPTLGPVLSSVPAIVVALSISPTMALFVILAYILIQMTENNLLVPKIMQHAVGLNPIVIIVAITAGADLLGILGALLAIPFVSFLIVVFNGFNEEEK